MDTLNFFLILIGDCGPYLDFLLPDKVGQLLDSPAPEQERQRVKIPDVELVVQWATEAHANEIRSE